jgi:hypothetical protein
MGDLTKTSPVQALFERVLREGIQDQKDEADRKRDGTYISGFRDQITLAELKADEYIVQAKKVAWQTFSLYADGKAVFEAAREGASTSKNFGAEERYVDTTRTSEGEWTVVQGKLPAEFEVVPA